MFFKKQKQIIEFASAWDNDVDALETASKSIPSWYKKIGNPSDLDSMIFSKSTIKLCAPFLDSMIAGYYVVLPCDLYVTEENGEQVIRWSMATDKNVVIAREGGDKDPIPVPMGCSNTHWAWKFPCTLKVSKGYAMLITHPLNRFDLPFYTLSGIIDGGFAMPQLGNISFFLKKNFHGLIPQGTPIAQVIPFKKQFWKKIKKESLLVEGEKNQIKSSSVMHGWYKKTYWTKKRWD
jgi:hypothetical protein